jgi:hypothetical protein
MRRTNFNDDHETFRKTLRAFIETEVAPTVVPVCELPMTMPHVARDECPEVMVLPPTGSSVPAITRIGRSGGILGSFCGSRRSWPVRRIYAI